MSNPTLFLSGLNPSLMYWNKTRVLFSDFDVVTERSRLHENFDIVTADKASNTFTFVCTKYYVHILMDEYFIYFLRTIWQIFLHQGFWTIIHRFSIPFEYRQMMKSWICHAFTGFQRCKNPYKYRFIAGSFKCSTKPLSVLLTQLHTHILKARSSEVFRNNLLKKWDQLDVDPKEF